MHFYIGQEIISQVLSINLFRTVIILHLLILYTGCFFIMGLFLIVVIFPMAVLGILREVSVGIRLLHFCCIFERFLFSYLLGKGTFIKS